MTAPRTNVAGPEHRKGHRLPVDSAFILVPRNRLRSMLEANRPKHPRYPSWITYSSQMPFRERFSHTLLLNRDLGKRRWTRICLRAFVTASPTNGSQPSLPTVVGTGSREDRGRITSLSSMAAVTTLTTRRRPHTRSRMTRSLLGCEYALCLGFATAPKPFLACERGGEREPRELIVL